MSASGDLQLIRAAALEAGRLAQAHQRQGLKVRRKPGGSPVTSGDEAVDRFLRAELTRARPDYGWLSEETADDGSRLRTGRTFMVDPVDGTSAYLKGRPWWVVSVAVVQNGRPLAGVVVAPELGEVFEAEAGGGARLNDDAIHASARDVLEGAAVLGDAKLMADPRWPETWPPMHIASRNAVAYRLALVAAGRFDAVLAFSRKSDWDLAAADLIAREAGAVVSDHTGAPLRFNSPQARSASLIAAGPALHALILQRTRSIDLPA